MKIDGRYEQMTSSILCALMKSMSEATSSWKGFIVTIKSLNFTVKRVRIDNDSVFLCAKFMKACQDENIVVERTVPYSHWQLARIERQWRTSFRGSKDASGIY
jgi:hypothetical protein